jgi:hypothetical protein
MIRPFASLLNPAGYHGHAARPPFFEGWYYKLIDPTTTHRFAVIPGIFKNRDPQQAHAFIQVLNGETGTATYHRYPTSEFWASRSGFELRIGPNRFTQHALRLEIDDELARVRGSVTFSGVTGWPVSLLSPGIMGPFAYVPLMETYHGVLSFDHALTGSLTVNGQAIELTGGQGYIEKDWGKSFPAAWVWAQTNHFATPNTCLTASTAIIPWLHTAFGGFIAGVWTGGQLYRFATYTGARVEHFSVGEHSVEWTLRGPRHRLEMTLCREEGVLLQAPTVVDMGRRIPETLRAEIHARLTETRTGRVLLDDTGGCAGLEVVGDLQRLKGMLIQSPKRQPK